MKQSFAVVYTLHCSAFKKIIIVLYPRNQDELDLLQNGWDYALKDFVENYKKEHIDLVRSSASISSKRNDGVKHHDFDDKDIDYPIKFIPLHKCRYCLEGFKNEEEKKIHELNLHV